MNIKILMMGVAGMAFLTLANAQAATTRTYDKNGMLVQEGSDTYVYEYYEDGRLKKDYEKGTYYNERY